MGREQQIINERKRKIEELRKQGINPYAYRFDKKQNVTECLKSKIGTNVKTAGRLITKRDLGKIIFANLQDFSGKIQLVFQEKETPEKIKSFFKKYIDTGDFLGIEGKIFETKTKQISILIKKIELLSKAILPLPEKWHGLKDKEERYRKRYLDMVMNPDVKEVFVKKQEIINAIREFLVKKDYLEVQTPILQPIYGGANAKPFISKLNALDMSVYMRISNEMYLKRLIVGGFEKLFEFSVDFRNEGIDKSHNPEFTLFEAMTAYTDYNDGMKLIEEITKFAVKKITGSTKINYQGKTIDFKTPWKRVRFRDVIKKYAKIDIENMSDEKLKKFLKQNNIEISGGYNRGNALMAVLEEFCESNFIQPTILYDYPIETSALAKKKRNDPKYTERFEQYVNGFEIGNNYTEVTDPDFLRENWEKQEEALKKGDEEAQKMDEDYLHALGVGMPPTCGIAISIDRIAMLFTNQPSIRDVIMFPFMKPEEKK